MLKMREWLEKNGDVEIRSLEDVNGDVQVLRICGRSAGVLGLPVGLIFRRTEESEKLEDDVWAYKCMMKYLKDVCWYAKEQEVRV